MLVAISSLVVAVSLAGQAAAHAAIWHPSMYGFNATEGNNRALDPLMFRHFNTSDETDTWWFHGHLKYPPHPEDIMQLPVGGEQMFEISCDKGTTSYWESAPGGNTASASQPDYPCPGQPLSQFHTTGENDTGGCALAIAYKSNAWEVEPEDFVVFSVNQTCVWSMHTYFSIPDNMPPCPDGKCTCAFFWGHQADSGSEQIYMNGFQCNMQGATSTQSLPQGNPARRCGTDPYLNRAADPSNCTIGAKQPNYWIQLERNNQFEDQYHPPSYQSLYGFMNGAQTDLYDGIGATQPTGTSPGVSATGAPATTTHAVAVTSTMAAPSSTAVASSSTAVASSSAVIASSSMVVASSPKVPASSSKTPAATSKAAVTTTPKAAATTQATATSAKKAATSEVASAGISTLSSQKIAATSSSVKKIKTTARGGMTTIKLATTFTLLPKPTTFEAAPSVAKASAAAPSPSSASHHVCKRGGPKRGLAHRAAAPPPRGIAKHRRAQRPSNF